MVVDYQGGVLDGSGNPIPAGGYLYLYQIENTSAVAMDALSITMQAGAELFVTAAGEIPLDDLDAVSLVHPAHAGTVNPNDDPPGGSFPLLNGEEGPFPLQQLTGLQTSINLADSNVTWTFNPLAAGSESNTLFLLASKPPIYGNAVAQDSTPPSPWGSLAPNGDPLPVPAPIDLTILPEPSSLVLLGIGTVAAAVAVRRRKRRR
jgi:hypothetical protein